MNNETTLLPCPICGGEAHTYKTIAQRYCAICNEPFCANVGPFDTEVEAIAAWNSRAERTCKQSRLFNLVWSECSSESYEWHGNELPNYCPNCGARVAKSDQYL